MLICQLINAKEADLILQIPIPGITTLGNRLSVTFVDVHENSQKFCLKYSCFKDTTLIKANFKNHVCPL